MNSEDFRYKHSSVHEGHVVVVELLLKAVAVGWGGSTLQYAGAATVLVSSNLELMPPL